MRERIKTLWGIRERSGGEEGERLIRIRGEKRIGREADRRLMYREVQ